MAATFNSIMARPLPVIAGLLALGAVLAFIELGTVAAAAFMLAGLALMYGYGRNSQPR
jgi:hypothetical protein